ncbi:hypothetical protein TNIN_343211 [Trichonephila inaurata madagascariensis]|uniref:Uncharacterized protein n=1 Tax=Trichonephila inaurata madagascariensis TaxID=2747483 RepID=A0A8X6XBV2_9ARAC|nr:hypothetical protein TNIN_343211 [Trichonephila inaurata madagascariensis]
MRKPWRPLATAPSKQQCRKLCYFQHTGQFKRVFSSNHVLSPSAGLTSLIGRGKLVCRDNVQPWRNLIQISCAKLRNGDIGSFSYIPEQYKERER